MQYDIEKINALFRGVNARKISIAVRAAGCTDRQTEILKLQWLRGWSDTKISMELSVSTATITRDRRDAYQRILSTLDLYGYNSLDQLDHLALEKILKYTGYFYQAQDELLKYFVRHNDDEPLQEAVVNLLKSLNARDEHD